MRAASAEPELTADLYSGETVLWTGPATFTPAKSSIPVLICFGLLFVVYWATRHSLAFERSGTASYSVFYWLLPLLLVLFSTTLLFSLAERLMMSSGRAHSVVMLTDRRLFRVTNWPWHRVWAADYRVNPRHQVAPGVLRHGRHFVVALLRKDAETVLDLIHRQRVAHG